MELTYNKNFTPNQHLLVNAGVTFLKSVSSDAVPSFYIISHAKTLVQLTAVYSFKNISLSTSCVYKERIPTQAPAINAAISKNYFLLNGKLGYTIKQRVKLFVACNNITDISYSDLLGSIMPARWTTAGVSVNL